MSSIVIDLQNELLKSNCDVLVAIRKAHVIASKLKLTQFDTWVYNELNGYTCSREELPNYRKVRGVVKAWNPARGWIPYIICDNELEELVSTAAIFEPISTIREWESSAKNSSITFQYKGEILSQLVAMSNMSLPMNIELHVPISEVAAIQEIVKTQLLEWTLRLEEQGIKGENMSFTQDEVNSAHELAQQVNNYYGTVVNGNVSQSQIASGENNLLIYSQAQQALGEAKEAIEQEQLGPEDKQTAIEILNDISEKIDRKEKGSIIKASLKALGSFLLSVGANVTADIIINKMTGMF